MKLVFNLGLFEGKGQFGDCLKKPTHIHVIVRRRKGFSELMWWIAFSYDKKGPFHIWEEEIKEETEACARDLAKRNADRYENDKVN
jgi:diadenosine tetraphosphate (Ap4A) HIT family hydrolase